MRKKLRQEGPYLLRSLRDPPRFVSPPKTQSLSLLSRGSSRSWKLFPSPGGHQTQSSGPLEAGVSTRIWPLLQRPPYFWPARAAKKKRSFFSEGRNPPFLRKMANFRVSGKSPKFPKPLKNPRLVEDFCPNWPKNPPNWPGVKNDHFGHFWPSPTRTSDPWRKPGPKMTKLPKNDYF